MTDQTELTAADLIVASALVTQAEGVIRETVQLAEALGTQVNILQILGAFLGVSVTMSEEPLTREQFNTVYDVFEKEILPALAPAGPDFGDGPEATAEAATTEETSRMAGHWQGVIENAAFDLAGTRDVLRDLTDTDG